MLPQVGRCERRSQAELRGAIVGLAEPPPWERRHRRFWARVAFRLNVLISERLLQQRMPAVPAVGYGRPVPTFTTPR